jgi:uncharacterized protein (TIGR01244 family)
MKMAEPFAPGLHAGGQPLPADLAQLAAQGVRTVINLRAPGEPCDYDEAGEASRLGLRYVCIPVTPPDGITAAIVSRFSRELDEARRHGATLVHCASANRVGAMFALDQGLTRGASRQDALTLGRGAGLTTLEPLVERLLAERDAA